MRNDREGHAALVTTALDLEAQRSLRRAYKQPLVAPSRWQMVLPSTPGEVTVCRILSLIILAEVATLALGVWLR